MTVTQEAPLPVAAILASIEAREVVSLPALGRAIGMGQGARKHAIRAGLLTPIEGPLAAANRRDGHTITRAEAFTLVLAAVLAVGAGAAVVVMLRGVKSAGLVGDAAAAVLRGMA